MTSRDWQADRRAVFDRDDRACRHCETTGDDADPTALRTYPVGAVPLEGTVHESSLATVCPDCFETLRFASDGAASPAESVSSEALFRLVRETTRVQGGAISDIASFASLATSLPTTLADVGTTADAGDDSESTVDETAAAYRDGRREALLALDVADARLERVPVDGTAFDADVRSSLSTVAETATDLQATLREAVARSEIVPVCLGRCHGCFEPLEGEGACSTCGLEARETADWRGDGGEIAFERLFSSINDSLQGASTTTETLTDRTMTLASQLTES
ncbi:HNH endonuclease [Haloterrigena sp. SYSU A558-1]|uniref:HNH endonuclease n=1 Tax=Haloterrigena gelatinilytica TaxID=2741724 RepID=A0ABX2LB61_9EURY|nr:HNH endonuclease [Haloterrigena gelatinilytica]NUC73492.1 HNH endonuclease [Haloterrigena gelatinilytica]